MNNYMTIKWITWQKWTDSQESAVSPTTEPGRNRDYDDPTTSIEIKTDKKSPKKQKPRT